MSKKKRILLVGILLIPSLIYFFFELTQANFKKMAYYGPKTVSSKGDTLYYASPLTELLNAKGEVTPIDSLKYPVYLICFLNDKDREKGYNLAGLLDYTLHNPNKLKLINILLVSPLDSGKIPESKKTLLKINENPDIEEYYVRRAQFDSVNDLFFNGKPAYVFNYFFALTDKQRHIRGYYDPTFVAEVKRMIQEFEHLKLRDEKAKLQKMNKLEKK